MADPIIAPVKWSQLPDMDLGTDWLSIHQADGPIVADDFMSNGQLITGFHWWGSYLDGHEPTSGWKWFEVSMHPDDPTTQPFSQPGYFQPPEDPYRFQFVLAQETYYGTTAGGEKVYEYWALLNEPWTEEAGETYWVDFGYDMGQNTPQQWGWHETYEPWNDLAVQSQPPSPGGNPHMGPWAPLEDHDMAFQVLTTPEPGTLLLLGSLGALGGFGFIRRRKKT